jgi:hypothetical protein
MGGAPVHSEYPSLHKIASYFFNFGAWLGSSSLAVTVPGGSTPEHVRTRLKLPHAEQSSAFSRFHGGKRRSSDPTYQLEYRNLRPRSQTNRDHCGPNATIQVHLAARFLVPPTHIRRLESREAEAAANRFERNWPPWVWPANVKSMPTSTMRSKSSG